MWIFWISGFPDFQDLVLPRYCCCFFSTQFPPVPPPFFYVKKRKWWIPMSYTKNLYFEIQIHLFVKLQSTDRNIPIFSPCIEIREFSNIKLSRRKKKVLQIESKNKNVLPGLCQVSISWMAFYLVTVASQILQVRYTDEIGGSHVEHHCVTTQSISIAGESSQIILS